MQNGLAHAMAWLALAWIAPWAPQVHAACVPTAAPYRVHRATDPTSGPSVPANPAPTHHGTCSPDLADRVPAIDAAFGKAIALAQPMVADPVRDGAALASISNRKYPIVQGYP